MVRYLGQGKQILCKKKIFGFDIETYGRKNKFLCATIYLNDDNIWFFKDKRRLIEFFKRPMFNNSYVVATNLGFDFYGTFYNEEEAQFFKPLFRGSDLISLKAYIDNGSFRINTSKKRFSTSITFIDTLNYAGMSVKKIGKIVNVNKLEHPIFLGKKPIDDLQWEELKTYNINDAKISKLFLKFLFNAFEKLGATPRVTIASTSKSLFRNKYLDRKIFLPSKDILLEFFKGYYGGRCEVFKRGYCEDMNYYDFNSLYPSVMKECIYPDPNTLRISQRNTIDYINYFEGVSDVDIYCPYMKIPLLPVKKDGKLIFPYGNITGYYSHCELRKALELGYVITKVKKSMYFKSNMKPFEKYVDDLYTLRCKYKDENNPMELVCKLLMNSLYGKFAERFWDRDAIIPASMLTMEMIKTSSSIEKMSDDFYRLKNVMGEPQNHCIPVWAIYTTAYGRLKLHDTLLKCNPIYCDTDSIICKEELPNSKQLGFLKLEHKIKRCIIIKPKFYAFTEIIDNKEMDYVKIKGVRNINLFCDFQSLIKNPNLSYEKFAKFKESVRRKFTPNEILNVVKDLDIFDNKRVWINKKIIEPSILEESEPIFIDSS